MNSYQQAVEKISQPVDKGDCTRLNLKESRGKKGMSPVDNWPSSRALIHHP
jgi:hypothetical protein